MIVCITQPTYLPWLGFFDKLVNSDIVIFYDTAQFVKRGEAFHNRNKIRTPNGWMWLTIPVIAPLGTEIKDVRINNTLNWREKHWKSIVHSYRKAKFFDQYEHIFEEIYSKDWGYLCDFNIVIIRKIIEILGIKIDVMLASELGETNLNATDELLWYCKKVKATTYLSGAFGKDYLDISEFEKEGIKVLFQDFKHPIYRQAYNPFIPNMSSIDLLFNYGKDSMNILTEGEEQNEKS